MIDVVAELGLGWLYDKVEKRYGRLAAWLVTVGLTLAVVAIPVIILVKLF